MKKLISILLVLTCLLGLFVTASAEDFSAGYDGSEVTITFYHTMGNNLTPVLDQYIAEFNTLYPNIHVEYTSVGGYDDVRDQVSTEITVGAQPNIAYCYPDHVAMYNLAMAVQTLDELIGMYEMSVGRGANFLLNIGPDALGRIPAPAEAILRELALP